MRSVRSTASGSAALPRPGITSCYSPLDLVRCADAEDATAKRIVKKPIAACVDKAYEEGDFAALGIGV